MLQWKDNPGQGDAPKMAERSSGSLRTEIAHMQLRIGSISLPQTPRCHALILGDSILPSLVARITGIYFETKSMLGSEMSLFLSLGGGPFDRSRNVYCISNQGDANARD